MEKTKKLKEIKDLINAGFIIRVFKQNNDNITLWVNDNKQYIMWQSYGQSAVKNNMKDLTWLINDLFEAKRKDIFYKTVPTVYAKQRGQDYGIIHTVLQ